MRDACTANSMISAETSIRLTRPSTSMRSVVIVAPSIAPSVPPAATNPKSRFPCPGRKTSVISDQKTETTNRLKTLVQMKKTYDAQSTCLGSAERKTRKKMTRLRMKKRYAHVTKPRRLRRETSDV